MICCVAALAVMGLLATVAEGVRRALGREGTPSTGAGFAPPARRTVDADR